MRLCYIPLRIRDWQMVAIENEVNKRLGVHLQDDIRFTVTSYRGDGRLTASRSKRPRFILRLWGKDAPVKDEDGGIYFESGPLYRRELYAYLQGLLDRPELERRLVAQGLANWESA